MHELAKAAKHQGTFLCENTNIAASILMAVETTAEFQVFIFCGVLKFSFSLRHKGS